MKDGLYKVRVIAGPNASNPEEVIRESFFYFSRPQDHVLEFLTSAEMGNCCELEFIEATEEEEKSYFKDIID